MSYREALITTALLGTENQGLSSLDCDGDLAAWLNSLFEQSQDLGRERVVLHAAALVYTHARAGALLAKYDGAMPELAPEENLPLISEKAAQHLGIISQFHYALLVEWFGLVIKHGRRIREEQLAFALALGTSDAELQPLLRQVVGERGKWLAKQNSDWRYVLFETKEVDWDKLSELWSIGLMDERVELLTIARKNDPTRALALLSSTWKEEATQARVKFLDCLDDGLSMADEPFLEETALNDKRKEVRTVAQRLLTLIPESRYQQRARQRLFSSVKIGTFEATGLAKLNPNHKPKRFWEIEIPEVDKEMLRDGISAKSNNSNLGDKAYVLLQLVAAVEPFEFARQYNVEYDELLDLAEKCMWMDAMLNGLEDAAIIFSNSAAAKAHLSRANCNDYEGLAQSLTDADREFVLTMLFQSNNNLPPSTGQQGQWIVLQSVLNHMGKWSVNFSKLMMQVMRNHLRVYKGDIYSIDDLIKGTASRIDISVIPEFQSVFGSFGSVPLIDKALETMFFRLEMKNALQHD